MQDIFNRDDVTSEEWKAHAIAKRAESQARHEQKMKNWEDDTWDFYANAIMAKYEREAEAADAEGFEWIVTLADESGVVLDAKKVEGKYGWVWLIKTPEGETRWQNISRARDPKRKAAYYENAGLQLVRIKVRVSSGQYGIYPDRSRGVFDVEYLHESMKNGEQVWA